MAAVLLTCDDLGGLDGGIVRGLINTDIAKIMGDLDDRGAQDGKTRKLCITVNFTMVGGQLVNNVQCEAKLPPRQSNDTIGKLVQKHAAGGGIVNMFLFQEDDPSNPDQNTLDFHGSEEGEIPNE